MRTLYALILSLVAALAAGAQDGGKKLDPLKKPGKTCGCEEHEHTRITDGWKNSLHHIFVLMDYENGGSPTPLIPMGYKYNSTSDSYKTKEDGMVKDAAKAFRAFNPHSAGPAATNGIWWTDECGVVQFRVEAPSGDVMMKGYMGSDWSALNFSIPQYLLMANIKPDFEKTDSWTTTSHPHSGSATVAHELYAKTSMVDIGAESGTPITDVRLGSTNFGKITPYVRTDQWIDNIGDLSVVTDSQGNQRDVVEGKSAFGAIFYTQEKKRVTHHRVYSETEVSFDSSGPSVTNRSGREMTWTETLETPTKIFPKFQQIRVKNKPAISEASAGYKHQALGVAMSTDDMCATWELYIKVQDCSLEIWDHDAKPEVTTESVDSDRLRRTVPVVDPLEGHRYPGQYVPNLEPGYSGALRYSPGRTTNATLPRLENRLSFEPGRSMKQSYVPTNATQVPSERAGYGYVK